MNRIIDMCSNGTRGSVVRCGGLALAHLMAYRNEDGGSPFRFEPHSRQPETLFGFPVVFDQHAPDNVLRLVDQNGRELGRLEFKATE